MKVLQIDQIALREGHRLDAKYFASTGRNGVAKIATAIRNGMPAERLGDIANCWAPNRFKRAYAVGSEAAVPYLRPYDVFDYLPRSADLISIRRTKNMDEYLLKEGTILQTCSGRNLGPAVMVDRHLAKFMLSHDMVRIECFDLDEFAYFLLAFLSSPTGQSIVSSDKTGSVIDHVSVSHLENLIVPMFDSKIRASCASLMMRAAEMRLEARLTIQDGIDHVNSKVSLPRRSHPLREGWSLSLQKTSGRLDAAFYDPVVATAREYLEQIGGVRLGDVADVSKPAGRYKTLYVDEEYGIPLLSGRQVLQVSPINLKYLSPRALVDLPRYRLKSGSIIMQADGRAEERLGVPAVVSENREGWLASGHVARIVPLEEADESWIYCAIASDLVQAQISSLACGSMVDALYEDDLAKVILPPRTSSLEGNSVSKAWSLFSQCEALEKKAYSEIEEALTTRT